MITLAPLAAHRIAAAPDSLDRIGWPDGARALRLAPDEVLALYDVVAMPAMIDLVVSDAHAIVEEEAGFSSATLTYAAFEQLVRPHIDWPIPAARPALAQGLVAGVPCKVWFAEGAVVVLCLTAHAHELEARL